MRITCSCPESLISDANEYAMCLGFSEADEETYRGLNYVDTKGNLYAAASFDARDEWILFAQAPLQRPLWDKEERIDLVAAERAQTTMVFSTEALSASPTTLTALGGMDGLSALVAMGLSVVTQK